MAAPTFFKYNVYSLDISIMIKYCSQIGQISAYFAGRLILHDYVKYHNPM